MDHKNQIALVMGSPASDAGKAGQFLKVSRPFQQLTVKQPLLNYEAK